jgi:hypothetical protein
MTRTTDRFLRLLRKPAPYLRLLLGDGESSRKSYVSRKYNLRHGLPDIDLLELFPDFAETVEPYSFLEGGCLPIDLAVLKALARRFKHCTYLEIGTWRGESAANVASVAEHCISLSLSEAEMRAFGLNDAFIETHLFFSKNLKNVLHIGHNSHTYDFSELKGTCDLVFVDGDHSYEGVKLDTENVFKLLRDERSVIVWHDYGISPETVRWSVLAGILDGCPENKRANLYHISNTLLAVYMQDYFPAAFRNFPQVPNKKFTITISATKEEQLA